jgi:antirestriction protein ArdC
MTGEAPRGRARLRRRATGERLSGFIYGTIVVLAVIVGGDRAYPDDAARIAAMVVVTSIVLWLAHVYAHSIQHSVAHDEHLSVAALRRIARREAAIVEAAVPPLAALVLGTLGVISTKAAVWAAFGLGLAVLAAQGVVFARVERLGWLGTVGVVACNLALGAALVGLKLVLSH